MRLKPLIAVTGCFMMLGGLESCGSDDNSSADSASDNGGQSADVVAGTKDLMERVSDGLAFSPTDFPESPDQIETGGEWRGPTEAPAHEQGKRIEVITCTNQALACVQAADGVKAAGKVLGWKVGVIDGRGTPEGYTNAFDTAFSRKPDAIIGIAVPALTVGDKLATAKERKIVTIGVSDPPPTGDQEPWQGYVSFREPLMESLLAYAEIARTEGKANSIVVTDSGQPGLVVAMDQYKKVLATCSGCKTLDVTWKISDAADPTKAASIINAALSRNTDATSISLPYSIGLPAVIQAIESAGKADQVKVLVKDADGVGLEGVRAGQVEYNSGVSPEWAGWAAADQVIRGLADEPYLEVGDVGLSLVTFTKASVPDDANINSFDGMVDFASQYKSAWGVN